MASLSTRTWLAALLVCFLCAATLGAQAPAPERRTIVVSVVDKEGNFVEGLTAANFRGEFRGQPVTIEHVVLQGGQRHIAVLLDVSATIRKSPAAWELAWAAARDLMLTLPPPHTVSVLIVSGRVVYCGSVSAGDQQGIPTFLRNLQPEAQREVGSTSLLEAMLAAANLKPSGHAPEVLYVISNGTYTGLNDAETEAERVVEHGLRPFFLVLPPGPEVPPQVPRWGRRWVTKVAVASGGLVIDLSRGYNKNDPFVSARPLYQSMIRSYVITVALPIPVDKPRKWKLEVVGGDGRKLKDVDAVYPRLLVPLPEPTNN